MLCFPDTHPLGDAGEESLVNVAEAYASLIMVAELLRRRELVVICKKSAHGHTHISHAGFQLVSSRPRPVCDARGLHSTEICHQQTV